LIWHQQPLTNLCKAVPSCTEHAIAGRSCYPGKPKKKAARVMVLIGHNLSWPSRCEGKTVLVNMEFEVLGATKHMNTSSKLPISARPNGGGNYGCDNFACSRPIYGCAQ